MSTFVFLIPKRKVCRVQGTSFLCNFLFIYHINYPNQSRHFLVSQSICLLLTVVNRIPTVVIPNIRISLVFVETLLQTRSQVSFPLSWYRKPHLLITSISRLVHTSWIYLSNELHKFLIVSPVSSTSPHSLSSYT